MSFETILDHDILCKCIDCESIFQEFANLVFNETHEPQLQIKDGLGISDPIIATDKDQSADSNNDGFELIKRICKRARKYIPFVNEFPATFDQDLKRCGFRSRYAFCRENGIKASYVSNISKMQKGTRSWKGPVRRAYEKMMSI